MPYTDPEKIKALLDPAGEQGAGSAASLDDDVLEEAADRATAEVNSRLGGRYRVPFAEPVPGLVTRIATDLAAYDATLSFYGSTDITDQDPVVRRYQNSLGLLVDIAAGRADLFPDESGGDTPGGSGRATVRNQYSGRLFGPEDLGLTYENPGLTGWWPSR